jgi:hypothetical protein
MGVARIANTVEESVSEPFDWFTSHTINRIDRIEKRVGTVSDTAQIYCALQDSLGKSERNRNMTPQLEDGNWQSVAEQVSKEMDPTKLTVLVAKLCRAFEIEDEKRPRLTKGLA